MLRRLFLLFLLLPFVIFTSDEASAFDYGDIVPIVSAQSKQKTITRNGLGAIFKMRLQQWRDGSAIKVYVLADADPLHDAFCKKILNVFPHQLRRSWNKRVFSGSGQAPITLKDYQMMLTKIANTPGAVGYMSVNDLNDQVNVLEIQ